MALKVCWDRTPAAKLPPAERISNFHEVNLGYTAEEAIVEAQRCLQCHSPSCQDGCPNNNPIRDFIALIAEGEFTGAAELIWTKNPLPSCTGRVCAWENQCEGFCVMGQRGDPINIGALERFAADYALQQRARQQAADAREPGDALETGDVRGTRDARGTVAPLPRREGKVAVIGAGPAGLTVAHFLGRKGYRVTVFDRYPLPGGVMAYGIPEFVLPQRVIDREAERIKGLGVEFRYGVTVGRDITIDELFGQGFAAIFIGAGANAPADLDIPGRHLSGVWTAKDFLMRASLARPDGGGPAAAAVGGPGLPRVGKRVAVVGAGNTAMDAARTAIRLGAEEVVVLYRRSEAESPSRPIEIQAAKEEGVQFRYLVNPVRFLGDDHGNLVGVELVRMRLETPDDSGRPRPVPIPGSGHVVAVDTCILAIGYSPETLLGEGAGLATTPWGGLIVDEATGATSREGVFAGGDCVTGSKTVVHAIAAGRRAAAAIERFLEERRAAREAPVLAGIA